MYLLFINFSVFSLIHSVSSLTMTSSCLQFTHLKLKHKAFYFQVSVLYSGQVHIKVTHRVFINVITVVINCIAAAAGSSGEVFGVNTTEKGR